MLKGCEAKATPAIITHKSVLLWLQLCQKVAVKTHESVIKIVIIRNISKLKLFDKLP